VKAPRLDIWYRIGRLLSRIFLPTFGSITVVGRENVPHDGPLLIACNHQTDSDPALVVYAIDRPLWFVAKRSLFFGPIISYLLKRVHVFPVDRDGRDIQALRWAQEMLDSGRALLIFPEGSRSPGALSVPPTDGLAYIALRTGVPILPVALTGVEKIGGMWKTAIHFQRLKVVIGEPFTLAPAPGRIDRELLQTMTQETMQHIAALLPGEYRGAYAALGDGAEGSGSSA
jgi:1-acyl-sn-glycerol-3-phosphate acyltransferase